MTPTEHLRAIVALLRELDPRAVADEIEALTGARVVAWSAKPAPARSADHASPLLDAVDRHAQRQNALFASGVEQAYLGLKLALGAQRDLCSKLSATDALDIVEAELGHAAITCANRNCARSWVPTPQDRCVAGRCFPCYEYRRRRHGQAERPRDLCESTQ